MAKKGQTCATCDATCCRLLLCYAWPPLTEGFDFMDLTAKQVKKLGFREFVLPVERRHDCSQLTPEGLCKLHGHGKPRFCASYWCSGRFWSPKGVRLAVPAGDIKRAA